MNCYEQDVEYLETKLRRHKLIGKITTVLTFGCFRNKANIQDGLSKLIDARKSLESYQYICNQIDMLDEESRTIVISGVRVSEHTFFDIPVTAGEDYGIDWDVLRMTVLERDDFECQESDGYCQGPLQVHHKQPLSRGGTNGLSNLVTLCHYHHSLKHSHMIKGGT